MLYKKEYNSEKTKQIIRYIIHKMVTEFNLENISRLKIHHIIFFSEKEHYHKTGESLTGATYYRHKDGPISYEICRDIKEVMKEVFTNNYKGAWHD